MTACIGFCPSVGSGGWSSANAPQNGIANVNVGGAGMPAKPASVAAPASRYTRFVSANDAANLLTGPARR